jgi:hypothetical protein
MRFRRKFFAKALLVIAMIALASWIVMSLWNWVVPGLFAGAHVIDYPRAFGLLVLCRILFGGFRGAGFGGWKGRQWQRWQQMTPEEREQLRHGMRSACSRDGRQSRESGA